MEVIDINKKVFSKTKEFEVREDAIVPDVKPDIMSVIDCSGISYAYKTEQTDGKIKLDGNIEGYISYLSVDGDTRGIQATFAFNDSIEDVAIKENSFVKYDIKIIKTDTKVLNERKISNVFTLQIRYEVFETKKVEIYNEFETIKDVELQKSNYTINSLVGIGVSKASVKEDIKLEEMDVASEILKAKVNVQNSDYKISYNKVLAKAEANVVIVYLTEDNRISKVEANLPLMSFIDIENVKEGNICNNYYQIKNILIKPNNGDNHTITCQIEFEISVEAYLPKELNIVSDLYSLSQDIEFKAKTIEFENLSNNNENIVNIDEEIEIEDIKRVLDVDSSAQILKNTYSGDTSNIEGEVNLRVYYEVLSESGLKMKNLTLPFISKINKAESVDLQILKNEFDSNNGNLILKIEVSLIDKSKAQNTITVIDSVEVKEKTNTDDYSMVIYLVKKDDTIWKIAKNFKVTMESIIKINNLENPNLIYPGDKLYIMK